jgi:hypothetical protein
MWGLESVMVFIKWKMASGGVRGENDKYIHVYNTAHL